MIPEIFHYLTLSYKTKKKLHKCLSLLESTGNIDTNLLVEMRKEIKKGNAGTVVDKLINIKVTIKPESSDYMIYWGNLYWVASSYKNLNTMVEIEKRIPNIREFI